MYFLKSFHSPKPGARATHMISSTISRTRADTRRSAVAQPRPADPAGMIGPTPAVVPSAAVMFCQGSCRRRSRPGTAGTATPGPETAARPQGDHAPVRGRSPDQAGYFTSVSRPDPICQMPPWQIGQGSPASIAAHKQVLARAAHLARNAPFARPEAGPERRPDTGLSRGALGGVIFPSSRSACGLRYAPTRSNHCYLYRTVS